MSKYYFFAFCLLFLSCFVPHSASKNKVYQSVCRENEINELSQVSYLLHDTIDYKFLDIVNQQKQPDSIECFLREKKTMYSLLRKNGMLATFLRKKTTMDSLFCKKNELAIYFGKKSRLIINMPICHIPTRVLKKPNYDIFSLFPDAQNIETLLEELTKQKIPREYAVMTQADRPYTLYRDTIPMFFSTFMLCGNDKIKLNSLPDNISKIRSCHFIFRNNALKELPAVFYAISKITGVPLRTLDLSFNKFSTIPKSISKIDYLESIDITGNQFDNIFETLSNICAAPSILKIILKDAKYKNIMKNLPAKLQEIIKEKRIDIILEL